jgi:hypothetical protein
MHTAQPLTYQQIWDGYAAGEISTTVLRSLLRTDEVFRAWCERKARAERKRRDQCGNDPAPGDTNARTD